jgi:hypothetical protein
VRLGERGLHFHLGEEVKFDDEGSNGLESILPPVASIATPYAT